MALIGRDWAVERLPLLSAETVQGEKPCRSLIQGFSAIASNSSGWRVQDFLEQSRRGRAVPSGDGKALLRGVVGELGHEPVEFPFAAGAVDAVEQPPQHTPVLTEQALEAHDERVIARLLSTGERRDHQFGLENARIQRGEILRHHASIRCRSHGGNGRRDQPDRQSTGQNPPAECAVCSHPGCSPCCRSGGNYLIFCHGWQSQ